MSVWLARQDSFKAGCPLSHEELVELLDERGIGYWTNEDQAVRLDLRGQVAVYRITAGVEPALVD